MELRLGSRRIDLSNPVVMGILNVTPDSFSDGGRFGNATPRFVKPSVISPKARRLLTSAGSRPAPAPAKYLSWPRSSGSCR